MTEIINIVNKILFVVAVIVTSEITRCSSAISDRRLCFDPKCSELVSLASTVMSYPSNDPAILSFDSNVDVKVFSKSAGKRPDLWGVEINGKRGYVPKSMIREKRVYKKKLIHEVPTEDIIGNNDVISIIENLPKVSEKVDVDDTSRKALETNEIVEDTISKTIPEPSKISPSFEIHDGTTLPMAINEEAFDEPSYSTDAPRSDAEIVQHPVLSVHPNIASSVTMKNHEFAVSNDDDGIVDEHEYPKNSDSSDSSTVDSTNETNLDGTSNNSDASSLEASSGHEESSETTIINPAESNDEITLEIIDTANNIADNSAEESKNHANNSSLDEQTAEEIKASPVEHMEEKTIEESPERNSEEATTTDVPVVERKEEKTNRISVEQRREEEKITETPVKIQEEISLGQYQKDEKTTEIPREEFLPEDEAISEFPENTTQPEVPEKISDEIESVQNEQKIIDDSGKFMIDNEKMKNPVSDDKTKESENLVTTESDISANEADIVVKLIEERSIDEDSSNLNIMSPLFNRLSMLPSMMKEIVDKTISSNSAEKESTSEEKPETKNTNEDIDNNETRDENESLPDNYERNVDNSTEIFINGDTTKPEVVQHGNDEKSEKLDDNNNPSDEINENHSAADSIVANSDFVTENPAQPGINKNDESSGFGRENFTVDETSSFNEFPANRNLLNVGSGLRHDDPDSSKVLVTENLSESGGEKSAAEAIYESASNKTVPEAEATRDNNFDTEKGVVAEIADSCPADGGCNEKLAGLDENHSEKIVRDITDDPSEDKIDIDVSSIGPRYWETLTYLVLTALTTLIFSLGYYYIENARRDGQYIAKINQLEKQLLVCSKECTVLDDNLKSTKTKLNSIEDESFGSNEMVASLKTDLEASKIAKSELEDQVGMLEKELESATEAGLELERMLREILSTNEDNPLARSVEDLQTRLNAQQAANEALTNSLNLKAQENETLTAELRAMTLKSEQLEVEVTRINEELKQQNNLRRNLEENLSGKVDYLEKQIKDITAERTSLRKQLKIKEMELKDLLEVVNRMNVSELDFEKLYDVSRIKAEAGALLEERDELKIRVSEVEGAHQLLEEHAKLINEEVTSLSERCKLAEKAKRDAENRVEVLSNFFKEKETQRQKEEAIWLQKQGEVSSTVERLHTMQNEIHNYKQQIEMLKREILDQEREYKNQISSLETKSHENWVIARQNERRLEESKAEAGQLRNRLTLIEKNLNDTDPEAKLHRLEVNGETATSPQLFIGAEASSSPIMFTGSSGVPLPPPPSYHLYGPPVPPFMPPPPPHPTSGVTSYEVGRRPPPLGGRLSSPPPLHTSNSNRYDVPRSPPSPLSPSMIPPYGPPHRGFPPPFPSGEHPPLPHSIHLPGSLIGGSSHAWSDETLPPPPPPPSSLRNSVFQSHRQQQQQPQHHRHRDNQQRARNHKGSLHSSGESLDKNL